MARAQTVTQLIIWRCIQAMGAAPGLSGGAGVIGDIYKLAERGAALGSYFGVSSMWLNHCLSLTNILQTGLLGLALAPTIGGPHIFPSRC